MSWKIGQAKQHLSAVVRQAGKEPQVLTNRARVVAAVINAEEFEQFRTWKAGQAVRSLAQSLLEARKICGEEGYRLVAPPRADRENPLLKRLPRAPARHKRHQ